MSRLPAPAVIVELDFETILAEMVADLQARDPEYSALVETDPAMKLLEVAAYRELLLRQRVNEAARSLMLAYAAGEDLDNIAANFNVERLVVDAGDPEAVPPVPPTYESDDNLRERVLLAFEALNTAGSSDAYRYHARSASGEVKDVSVTSPAPCEVVVTVLSTDSNGAPSPELLALVEAALSDEDKRPLTDQVTVQEPTVVEYVVDAELTFFPGPDAETVRQASEDAVTAFVAEMHRLGRDITLDGLYAALRQPGVQKVTLNSPAASLVIQPTEVAWCTGITVAAGGVDE